MATIPFSPPSWLTEARVLRLTTAVLAAALANPVILSIPRAAMEMRQTSGAPVLACVTTVVLSVLLASWAFRLKRFGESFALTVGVGAFAGVLNLALIYALVTGLASGSVVTILQSFVVAMFMGSFVGGAVGCCVGLFYAPFFAAMSRLGSRSSHEGRDIGLALSGTWMIIASVGISVLDRPARPVRGILEVLTAREAVVPLLVTLGASLVIVGVSRIVGRRRWLGAVKAGQIEGWQLDNGESTDTHGATPVGSERLLARGDAGRRLLSSAESPDAYRRVARVPTPVAAV